MLRIREAGPGSRRSFLQLGALGLGGLTLADWLGVRATSSAADAPKRDVSVIQVYLGGGPSHVDTYDPKPDAPAEYRGEFRPIATSVPGVFLCEHFPNQARLADKLVLVRSLHHTTSDHSEGSHWMLTGHPARQATPRAAERPSIGSVVARVLGTKRPGLPSYVALPDATPFSTAAYLGPAENPFSPEGLLSDPPRPLNLQPQAGVTLQRLGDRRSLLRSLDRFQRERDDSGLAEGLDRFSAEAFAMITGPAAREAFDLGRETERTRSRYGAGRFGRACLLARRLVESGVAFVTVNEGGWDHHGQIFPNARAQLPPIDRALAALVEDLHARGLADKVLVVVCGEFGRTPRVNGAAGRDHWPGAFSAVLAGGGIKTGQVVGSSGPRGESPVERPVSPEDLIQTVYAVLGIDSTRTFTNEAGRPLPILGSGRPIAGLL